MLKTLYSLFVLMVVILFTPYFGFTPKISGLLTSLYMGDMQHAQAILTGNEDDWLKQHGVVLKDSRVKAPDAPSQVTAGQTVETGAPKK